MPVPGSPTVVRVPLGPRVTCAPFRPSENDIPVFPRLRLMPGKICSRRRNRKAIAFSLLGMAGDVQPLAITVKGIDIIQGASNLIKKQRKRGLIDRYITVVRQAQQEFSNSEPRWTVALY